MPLEVHISPLRRGNVRRARAETRVRAPSGRPRLGCRMTNAPDFNLDDELSETRDWDADEPDSDELDSRDADTNADAWADEPDPEEADGLTGGDHDLAE